MWPDEGEEGGGEGHPALLIDRHVHPETILLNKFKLTKTESFKTLKISVIFCKQIQFLKSIRMYRKYSEIWNKALI